MRAFPPGLPAVAAGVGLTLVAVASGYLLTSSSGWAVVLLGLPGIVALGLALGYGSAGTRAAVTVLIAATFVTRFQLRVGGLGFRPEHVVLAVALVALMVNSEHRSLLGVARHPAVVLFGTFVIWATSVSIFRSAVPVDSLRIAGWLGLDILIMVVCASAFRDAVDLERAGVAWSAAAALVAIALWVAALLGITTFGVQTETLTKAPAAYGLAFEANILGSTLAVWLVICFTAPEGRFRHRALIMSVVASAIVLSLTRAALVSAAIGVAVWMLVAGTAERRRALRFIAVLLSLAVFLALVAPSVTRPFYEKITQTLDFSGNAAVTASTGLVRLDAAKQAVSDLGGVNWLTGLGLNSFGQRHLDPTRPLEHIPWYLGSLPLEILYDTGVLGIVLLGGAFMALKPFARGNLGRVLGVTAVYVLAAASTSPFWLGSTWVLAGWGLLGTPRIREMRY